MTQTPRLNIAVFIDFDNIEIGVKSTLGERFDVGAVLEAVKERGEVVTKIAYGDWTRAGDYSRMLTQHAVRMVQRNLTPGGDKNGADINLALDALEMAFAHHHISAFVIVGGDSDFITLVEKLKQYDKTVFVVGGRGFTSHVLQKNCHEFIAYENVVKSQASPRRAVERGRPAGPVAGQIAAPVGDAPVTEAFPLVRRALKLLADREVSAQLGLLKSTLLQLDSTFSERSYGSSSFRDFMQKLANAGFVTLKGSDRSLHVELRETDAGGAGPAPGEGGEAAVEGDGVGDPLLWAEGIRAMRGAFLKAAGPLRWPMYVRNIRQVLKGADEGFDERRYGFRGILDAVRMGQREGLFRVERDRRGILRVFPGPLLQEPAASLLASAATGEPAEWPGSADEAVAAAAETGSVEPPGLGHAALPPEAPGDEARLDGSEPAAVEAASAAEAPGPAGDPEPTRDAETPEATPVPARRRPARRKPGTTPRAPRRKKAPASAG